MSDPVLCCGTTPALQRTLVYRDWNADGDVIRANTVRLSAGGKATNAARAIQNLGQPAHLMGFAGGPLGQQLIQCVADEHMEATWIDTISETRICQTLMDQKRGRIRELVEHAPAVSESEWTQFLFSCGQLLKTHPWMCLSGSFPQNTPEEIPRQLAALAKRHQARLIADLSGPALLSILSEEPWFIKINRDELLASTGIDNVTDAMVHLYEQGAQHILITDGGNEARYFGPEGIWSFPLPKIQLLNPIGGGDTVTGVLATACASGMEIEPAIRTALGAALAQSETEDPAAFEPERAQYLSSCIG